MWQLLALFKMGAADGRRNTVFYDFYKNPTFQICWNWKKNEQFLKILKLRLDQQLKLIAVEINVYLAVNYSEKKLSWNLSTLGENVMTETLQYEPNRVEHWHTSHCWVIILSNCIVQTELWLPPVFLTQSWRAIKWAHSHIFCQVSDLKTMGSVKTNAFRVQLRKSILTQQSTYSNFLHSEVCAKATLQ